MASTPKNKTRFQSPKGTRDLYPDDLLRQRYITEAWRRVSIRHGFDEIAGPTFESLDLYKIKSGEGIVSELFSFKREGGSDDYALRPEFTPTLARLYAAKAASLPSPTKWFTAGPYFRAERPQRGRLREFLQWNCDVIGGLDNEAAIGFAETEVASSLLQLCQLLGLDNRTVRLWIANRPLIESFLTQLGVESHEMPLAFQMLDSIGKMNVQEMRGFLIAKGADPALMDKLVEYAKFEFVGAGPKEYSARFGDRLVTAPQSGFFESISALNRSGWGTWVTDSYTTVRGLAYYTGTVFELIADGERAVAGGGRYDNLIELFGGPPTPAVGFGMGDVVLGLLLDDKNLMPAGAELRDALSQPSASLRPEAFVIADEDQADLVEPLLASLRRGIERDEHDASRPWASDRYAIRPMHARRSYRAKRKKQMQDASAQFAMFAVTINERDKVELRDMDNPGDDLTPKNIDGFSKEVRSSFADFSVDPESPVYVGKAIASLLG